MSDRGGGMVHINKKIFLMLVSLSIGLLQSVDLQFYSSDGRRPEMQYWYPGTTAQLWGVPSLGIYSDDYSFRVKAFVVKHTPRILTAAPANVRAYGAGTGDDMYSIVWINHLRAEERRDNVVLHPVVRKWTNPNGFNDTVNFQRNVSAGVFDAHNIGPDSQAPIAFERVGLVDVNFHEGHFSPDNARVRFDPVAPYATFWLVAQLDGHVLVTYNVVVLETELINSTRALFSRTGANINTLTNWARDRGFEELRRIIESDYAGAGEAGRAEPGTAIAARNFAENTVGAFRTRIQVLLSGGFIGIAAVALEQLRRSYAERRNYLEPVIAESVAYTLEELEKQINAAGRKG